jgi:catechol 2,3-dioxygenase-like lactoylglutathione lyase family enzyme
MQFTIPQTKIGEYYTIHITTKDLEQSFEFWKKFGFKELFRYDYPFPFMYITDGTINIMLRKNDEPYIGLTYFVKDVKAKVAELEKEGISFIELPIPSAQDHLQRYKTVSPDGINLTIVTHTESFVKPTLPTMLHIAPSDYMNPEKYGNKTIGMFAEFAHIVKDLDVSIEYWDKLGFKVLTKHSSPYPWAILSDGTSVLGCHQSTHFSGVGITYFASDMKDKITALKENGLTNYKEMMGPDNIVVPTPEGQQLFLFKMGM